MLFTSSVIRVSKHHESITTGSRKSPTSRLRFQFRPRLQAATLGDRSVQRCMKSNTPVDWKKKLHIRVMCLSVNRCVRLEARLQTTINESSCLQSGAELKTDRSSRTLSALVSDVHVVFAYSITDEVNKMQYLSNTQTFQKRFHEQQKHFLYTA